MNINWWVPPHSVAKLHNISNTLITAIFVSVMFAILMIYDSVPFWKKFTDLDMMFTKYLTLYDFNFAKLNS